MTTKTLNVLWLLLLLGASSLLAQAPAEQAQERLRCIVVLRQGDLSDAEAQRLGGKVEFRSAGRLVLTIPRAAIDALRRNPNVKYIQESRFPGEIAAAAPLSAELTDSPETAAPLAASIPTWSSGDYQYDGAGNIYAIGTNTAPGSDGRSSTYSYDALGRLSAATVVVPGGTFSESYGYDAYGNLKSVTPGGGQPFDLSVNELTNKVAADYDQAGNMVRWGTPRFTYDGANMVSSRTDEGGNVEYYVYSADDERIGVLRGQRWSWTVRGMDQKVLRRFESDDAIRNMDWLWVEDYVYRDGAVVATERMAEEGGLQHLHSDHLGTTRLITGAAGALVSAHDYLPFGIELTSVNQHRAKGYANEEPSRFTGHERDFHGSQTAQNENYLDYMHARFYNPKLGRFLSVDPAPESAQAKSPQTWNRYAYVLNNPIRNVDPDGRVTFGSDDAAAAYRIAAAYLWQSPIAHKWLCLFEQLKGPNEPHLILNSGLDAHYNRRTNTISWDPQMALLVSGGTAQPGADGSALVSPDLILLHEIVHTVITYFPGFFEYLQKQTPGNELEEWLVINGVEARAAAELGEPQRQLHWGGHPVRIFQSLEEYLKQKRVEEESPKPKNR